MNLHSILVFLHVLGAVGVYVMLGIEAAGMAALRRARTPAEVRAPMALLALPRISPSPLAVATRLAPRDCHPSVEGLIIAAHHAPQSFGGRTAALRVDATRLRRASRLGLASRFGGNGSRTDQLDQSLDGIGAVALLGAKASRRDDEITLARQPRARAREEARTDIVGERTGLCRVETKLRRRRHLVDVLPARSG